MPYYFELEQSQRWIRWNGKDVVFIKGMHCGYTGVRLAPAEQDRKYRRMKFAEIQVDENSQRYAVPLIYSSAIFPGQKGKIVSEGVDIVDIRTRNIEAHIIFSSRVIR